MYKEIFVFLCLAAVVMVQAYPSEDLESQQAVEPVEAESNAEASDLEGAESRYGGWGRGFGGGWGGYGGGYGGGWNRGWGGGYGGYGGYGGGWGRGYGGHYGGGWNGGWRHYG